MTLVLYRKKYDEILRSELTDKDTDICFLNIDSELPGEGIKTYEDLLTNTNLVQIDQEVYRFATTWFYNETELEFCNASIAAEIAQPAKILAILIALTTALKWPKWWNYVWAGLAAVWGIIGLV